MKPSRRLFVQFIALTTSLSSAVSPADAKDTTAADQPKPSILILLVDDLGWGDVGYHDSTIATPNIDAIAANGVEFDRFYVNPTCSTTRASLLTGQFSTTHGVNGPIQWHSNEGLPLEWQTMADYLKNCLLYTSPSPRDREKSRMPSSA